MVATPPTPGGEPDLDLRLNFDFLRKEHILFLRCTMVVRVTMDHLRENRKWEQSPSESFLSQKEIARAGIFA